MTLCEPKLYLILAMRSLTSTHVLADNSLFSLILMPENINLVTVFEWEVFMLSDDCIYIFCLLLLLSISYMLYKCTTK